MFELELKFQVPAERRAALQRAVATSGATTIRLQARYFDTPERRLASAGLALRLRKEGPRWVQTLKGIGDGHLQRLEHEVLLAATRGAPALDIGRHAGTAVGEMLFAALGDATATLALVYQTDIRRTRRVLRSGGAAIELALDIGELRAGESRLAVHELELELQRGSVAELVAVAARWAARHSLWLDVRSKSERGDLLARGAAANAPVPAGNPALPADATPDRALRGMVGTCLSHLLPNAAAVAGDCGGPEHLHQVRVALRRLRTALRVFGDWSAAVDPQWPPALAALFDRSSGARDRDMLADVIWPALAQAGAPPLALPPVAPGPTPGDALRDAATTACLLGLIGFAHGSLPAEPAVPAHGGNTLARLAHQRIRRLHRQLKRDAKAFGTADDASRHRTRRRLKRLRYAVELTAGLFPAKEVRRTLERLRPAQDALGHYTDLCVAEAVCRELLAQDPRAWFALGWLAARRITLRDEAGQALQGLAKLPPVR